MKIKIMSKLYKPINAECQVKLLNNEQGMVLIIVLIALVLLSILGATMLDSSTSELKIAGNSRNNLETFYTADAALEFGQVYDQIYLNLYGTNTSWPMTGQGKILNASFAAGGNNTGNLNYNRITIPRANGTSYTADVKVDFIDTGNPPPGSGTQEDSGYNGISFKANYFVVSVIASGVNNTMTEVESQIARIVPQ